MRPRAGCAVLVWRRVLVSAQEVELWALPLVAGIAISAFAGGVLLILESRRLRQRPAP